MDRRRASPLVGAVRPREPRLDRVAARRGVRRGLLDGAYRERHGGAPAPARRRVPDAAAGRAGDPAAADVVRAAAGQVQLGLVVSGLQDFGRGCRSASIMPCMLLD